MRFIFATLLLMGAQEPYGGMVEWIRDPDLGLAKARIEARPTMLFFTAEWCERSQKLAREAFSDKRVVQASRKVVPILIDCSEAGQNGELQKKYRVNGYPTVIYTDPTGKRLKEMASNGAKTLVSEILTLARKYPGRRMLWQHSLEAALKEGRKEKRRVAIYVAPLEEDPLKFTVRVMKELGKRRDAFVWVLELGKKKTLRNLGIKESPAVIVIDPEAKEPLKKPLAHIPAKDPKALNKALDETLGEK